MGIECQILLNNPSKIYFPGEIVQGFVVIVNDRQRNIKGLKINFEGKCTVEFTESKQVPRRNRHENNHHRRNTHQHNTTSINTESGFETVVRHYHATESYLETEINVFGNDGREMIIMPGRYEYPFQFLLPFGLPSSFEGSHGKILYTIRAILPRSWAFDCKTFTTFRVNGILDLNVDPASQVSTEIRKHKNFGWCCCSSGDVNLVLKLSRSGTIPGSFVPFIAEINNKTDEIVRGSMSIVQKTVFFAQGKQKEELKKVCTFEGPSLAAGQDDIWRGDVIQVPYNVPPTRFGGTCRLIDVNYVVEMKVESSGCFSTLKAQLPLVIGSIPLREPMPPPNQSVFYDTPPPYNSLATSVASTAFFPGNLSSSNSVNYDNMVPTAPELFQPPPPPQYSPHEPGFKV